ncbi:MAG: PQQ-binding-like beta-propeller repeat protein [Actinomycetota bacterium]|nr:PQQ-binding-like beta-propeller repeat protein [Actinomycetota bacterium]
MRRVILIVVVLSLVAAACVAGADVIPVDPNASTTTFAPVTTLPGTETTRPGDQASTTIPSSTSTTTTVPQRSEGIVPPESVGEPWGEVVGLTMFRGNPTRTFFGSGPVPATAPGVSWRFPDDSMCGQSPVGKDPKVWCGSGWTGQPVVWERPDGITEVIFGAYDKQIHFLNAATGERTRPDFDMGDIIKGSVTLDPDGFPLLYTGSRDPRFRIIALDGDEPREVWSLHAKSVDGIWNDDWDSNPVIIDDIMYEGGENSWWFAVKLNRGYDADGKVTIDPQVVYQISTWTDELTEIFGRQHSVESSTAVFDQRAYFSTSAGRVVGVDVSDIESGNGEIFFDFWNGDDTDATISIDRDGFLYVVSHADTAKKNNTAARRVREVGDLAKLDPDNPDDPVVWSVDLSAARGQDAGAWATPALHADAGVLFVATDAGDLLAVDTATGETIWQDFIGGNAWSSPVIADDTLVVGVDCLTDHSGFRAYDLADPRSPQHLWDATVGTGACIESTPAVWNGRIYVGSRDGFFYALGN